MHILIANDDGIRAPGIHALAKAARQLGRVSVIAPDSNRSASGQKKTLGAPLRLDPFDFPEADAAWVCDGTPGDCVCFAGLGFLDEPVDFVLTGVNPTANLGLDMTYSGTVMAAAEANNWGLPSAAFSVDAGGTAPDRIDFSAVDQIVPFIISLMSRKALPPHTFLNVNFPHLPYGELKGYKLTRAGERIYRDVLVRCKDPFGRPYYWFGGEPPKSILKEGTDGKALADGYVSITPICLDLTAVDFPQDYLA